MVISAMVARWGTGADPTIAITNKVDRVVEEVTPRDGRIFVAGHNEGYQTYWLTDRNPATRYFFAEDMGASPYSYDPSYVNDVRRSLARRPPEAIVIWPDSSVTTEHYLAPAIARGGLRRVAAISTETPEGIVQIFARKRP
jgi:hypothetical protein